MDRSAIDDLNKVKEEFELIIESLELASDPDFMEGYREAKRHIRTRDLVGLDEL